MICDNCIHQDVCEYQHHMDIFEMETMRPINSGNFPHFGVDISCEFYGKKKCCIPKSALNYSR